MVYSSGKLREKMYISKNQTRRKNARKFISVN